MATTTPNYGWTVPTSTDLVKDGATAIETLGDAIDASMNTALGTKKAGMVLLNTTSFSGVASQSIDDVFSATYTNYKIVVEAENSGTGFVSTSMRMRVSGTDNSSSNYRWQQAYLVDTSAAPTYAFDGSNGLTTNFRLGAFGSTAGRSLTTIEMSNPFATEYTALTFQNTAYDQSTPRGHNYIGAGNLIVTTSYTGFTMIPSSNNITGSVSVYGYQK